MGGPDAQELDVSLGFPAAGLACGMTAYTTHGNVPELFAVLAGVVGVLGYAVWGYRRWLAWRVRDWRERRRRRKPPVKG